MAIIRIKQVSEAVGGYFGVTLKQLKSHKRTKIITSARKVCYILTRELTEYSFPEIAEYYKKDHTSVVKGISSKRSKLVSDAVDAVRKELKQGV